MRLISSVTIYILGLVIATFGNTKGILKRTRAERGVWAMDAHLTHNEVKFMEIWLNKKEAGIIY